MAIKDTIDGIKNLAVGMENLELISKLIDLQSQAYEILDENRELRLELERFKRQDELASYLSYEEDVYYRKDDNSGPYCSRCWDVGNMLVRLPISEHVDGWKGLCKECKSWGHVPEHRIPKK
ncbi:hypothetical protein [Lederbergia galactosidilytica]|uniref:Uncharacterized protein n=1 Tax=Lederbergia galactosidilytica TaxID=217031 RepID=A0A177ZXM0_9BACI|nr:hypothetical protein [Lederbergia galactosidilytica]OAK72677.1 hypothetical protein ABB05_07410 [Lederbergia galactosidilytica]